MKKVVLVVLSLCLCLSFLSGCASSGGTRTTGEAIDDAVIVADINKKIVKDPDLSYWKIHVASNQGNVVLTGTVKTQAAVDKATALAQTTKGVKTVQNTLVIQP